MKLGKHWLAGLALSMAATPGMAQEVAAAPYTFMVPVSLTNMHQDVAHMEVRCMTFADGAIVTVGSSVRWNVVNGELSRVRLPVGTRIPDGQENPPALGDVDSARCWIRLYNSDGERCNLRGNAENLAGLPEWCRPDEGSDTQDVHNF